MISRRGFLRWASRLLIGGAAAGTYAFGIEPGLRLVTTVYRPRPKLWPADFKLSIAVVSDIHAVEPWMSVRRIAGIVERTNALGADLIVVLGDFVAGHHWRTGSVSSPQWAEALSGLKAPLGVHAILGNHDWWDDLTAQKSRKGPIIAERALNDVGIPVHHNQAVKLEKGGRPFWLAGLGDQLALKTSRPGHFEGLDDLPGTLAQVTDDAPVILLAHEPDIFVEGNDRIALTLSGHTHGGQVRLFGYSPVVPSRFRNRFAYGHIVEDEHHLIVSGGLGCSIAPVRFGVPPEIVLVELGV